jgi:LuxR family transcriptional regulator, maltose regulon positive regulatory protein
VASDLAVVTPVTRLAPGVDGIPLLSSKFTVPRPPRFMVLRRRLLERLSRGVHDPVTLVTGPAGSGKTDLVASWVVTAPPTVKVVWITLEEGDGQPPVFWSYIVEGLQRAGLSVSRPVAGAAPTGAVGRAALARLAAELASQIEPVILVLDGVSSVSDGRWASDFDFVLRHTDQRLRLVLMGRSDPPLPLHRYRLAGRLSEVRGDDLAFTTAEAADLLALHDIELSDSALGSLMQHTEGWAAGLRLFAMAMQGRADAESLVATIMGDEARIAEYFVCEVLAAQSPDVREFLLKTSILDAFTPELAQVLTGRSDARRTLAALERENGFVQPVDDRSTAYRYHRLFAELLRAQLANDGPEQVSRLHRRAADWFAAEGQVVEAVEHAATAGDWGAAAAITIENYAFGRLVLGGDGDVIGALFRDLPDEVDNAESAVVAAALAFSHGDLDRCGKLLARADDLVDEPAWESDNALMLAGVVLEVLLAGAHRDPSAVLDSARVAEYLMRQAPADRLAEHPEVRVLLLAARAAAQSWVGAIDAATVTFTEAATAAAAASGCERVRMDCLQQLALLEAYRGRLRHTGRLVSQTLDLADQCGMAGETRPVGAELAMAWVAVERYDVDSAWRHLRAVEPMCGAAADGWAMAGFAVVKSRLLRARGEMRGALQTLRDAAAGRSCGSVPTWLARENMLGQARLLIATGRSAAAQALVRDVPEPRTEDVDVVLAAALHADGDPDRAREIVTPVVAAAGIPPPVSVEAWLLLATLAAYDGDDESARGALRHALRFATPETQRRAFHEVGAPLRRLLRDDEALAEHYQTLLGNPAHAVHPRPNGLSKTTGDLVLVETLSKREMEVLRQMAAMLPTEEIAACLYVSVNTVKTHVRSILRKLSASRRNEAVRRARTLGLI